MTIDRNFSPRTVQSELACARALLDELDMMFAKGADESLRRDIAAQAADELAHVASAMKRWASRRSLLEGGDVAP